MWRLVTSLAFFKQQNLFFLLQLYFLYAILLYSINISSSVERSSFKRGSIDFLYFLCLLCLMIYAFAICLKISFLSGIFIYAMYYYYGRIHSNRIIIVNFLPMRASFLIWYILFYSGSSCWLSGFLAATISKAVCWVLSSGTRFILCMMSIPRWGLSKIRSSLIPLTSCNFVFMSSVRIVTPLFNEEHLHQNNNDDDMPFWHLYEIF